MQSDMVFVHCDDDYDDDDAADDDNDDMMVMMNIIIRDTRAVLVSCASLPRSRFR